MRLVEIHEALCGLLSGADIGLVEGAEGRQESLPWGDPGRPDLPFWTVTLVSVDEKGAGGRTLGATCLVLTWALQGYFPHNFEAGTAKKWLGFLDRVIEVLLPSPALEVCAITRPVRLVEQDFALFKRGAQGGEVLCHYARFEFRTEVWLPN